MTEAINQENAILEVKEWKEALPGQSADEVVIALSPAFGTQLKKSIIEIDLGTILKELCAGIEEEGMKPRFIKVFNSTDLAIIASQGSRLSGSGICVGMQSRGTTVIHQRDLVPLDNLELFPQAPLYDEKIYRKIGRNAAKYAKGENPEPVEILNDYMVPSKYLIKSTLMHFKEGEMMDKSKKAMDMEVVF
jgi:propanediol dehydratase medium subunit